MLQSAQMCNNNGKTEAGTPSTSSAHSQVTPEQPPSAPPRKGRADRKNLIPRKPSATSPPRVSANGLPPTPKVLMGACFSKVFNECPLTILCSASWVHPDTRDQHVLLGCEEGLYTLNLNELHDACIDQLFPRKTTWLYVIKDILMTLSGKTANLYRHDLVVLHSKTPLGNNKLRDQVDQVINRIPEKFVPWKSSATMKIPNTKGCYNCCVARNPYNGYKYLAGASPAGIFLMQWYNPLNKFMLLKVSHELFLLSPDQVNRLRFAQQFEYQVSPNLSVFEMIITPDMEYPLLCIGVGRSYDPNQMKLDMVNLNSSASWFNDTGDGTDTVIPRYEHLDLVSVKQIDKDTILVCHDSKCSPYLLRLCMRMFLHPDCLKLTDLTGKLKTSRKHVSQLTFDYKIQSVGKFRSLFMMHETKKLITNICVKQ